MAKYPIFEQCKNYTLDPFWQDIFDDLYKGKFPEGMVYDPITNEVSFYHTISVSGEKGPPSTKTLKVIKTKSRNPLAVFRAVKNGLQQKGIYSPAEFPKNNNPIFRYDSWSQIKVKIVKEELVSEYVKRTFGDSQFKIQFEAIMSKIYTKVISPDDIILKDGKIETINSSRKSVPVPINFPPYKYSKRNHILTNAVREYIKEERQRDKL
jgi:hypothetical protein